MYTPSPASPMPDTNASPSTLSWLSSSTTAPLLSPGDTGLKTIDSVHGGPDGATLVPRQLPPRSSKSMPAAPHVRTCTVLTVPGAWALTLMECDWLEEPTACV